MLKVKLGFSAIRLRRGIFLAFAACMFGLVPGATFGGSYDDFFIAVKTDNDSAVRLLLLRGLDPNLIEEQRGDTGLIIALREDSMAVFEQLVVAPGIDLDIKARNGDTALMIAAYKGNRRAVQVLLEKSAEPNQPGWTALHYAAAIGNNEIVKMLLDHSAYIDAESPNKTTPLMMAARGGHILTVKLLLEEGADATLKNELGMSAIDFARKFEHQDIVDGLTFRLRRAGKLR